MSASALVLSVGVMGVSVGHAAAIGRDNTNPAACGTASSTNFVTTVLLQNYNGYPVNRKEIWTGGSPNVGTLVGYIEMRSSSYCGTRWARVWNYNHAGWQATGISRYSTNYGTTLDYVSGSCPTACIDNVGANLSSFGNQLSVTTDTTGFRVVGYILNSSKQVIASAIAYPYSGF